MQYYTVTLIDYIEADSPEAAIDQFEGNLLDRQWLRKDITVEENDYLNKE